MQEQTVRRTRIRKQRGYAWEDALVKRFRSKGWKAFRLGSPSIGLPDVIATNSNLNTIIAIEAKSGTTNMLMVEYDQILRCINWLDAFDVYRNRYPLLAFKFIAKKWKGKDDYKRRKGREYIKVWDPSLGYGDLICRYDGSLFLLINGMKREVSLADYEI